jgi:hypothetical protein
MAKPQKKIFQIVALIEANGPVSANRLTEITDDWRQTIDMYIRKAHKLGLIHIADFGPSPYGAGYGDVKLWAAGKGIDAKRVCFRQKRQIRTVERIRAKRQMIDAHPDPLAQAFFGQAAA